MKNIKQLRHKKVLITGGAGFIGSHLVEALVAQEVDVTILDNFSSGKREYLTTVHDAITIINDDILHYHACLDALRNQDYVIHLAAYTSVPQSVLEPEYCYQTNVIGTLNMLNAARECKNLKRFIFASSAAVYGTCTDICRETLPCNPQSPYATSKLLGEMNCLQYNTLFSIPTVITRFFNVYGNRSQSVISHFQQCLKMNKPITLYGDGMQTRDFVNVHNVVRALLTLLTAPSSSVVSQIINIGSGIAQPLHAVLKTLQEQYPSSLSVITYAPKREGDVPFSQADCTKLQTLLQEN